MHRSKLCIGNYCVLSVTNAIAAFGCLNYSLVCNLNVKTLQSHVALATILSNTRLLITYSTLRHSFFPHFHTLFVLPVSSEHIYTLYPYLHFPTRPFSLSPSRCLTLTVYFPLTLSYPHLLYLLFSSTFSPSESDEHSPPHSHTIQHTHTLFSTLAHIVPSPTHCLLTQLGPPRRRRKLAQCGN